MSFLHLTLLDVSCMTPELVSFVSQCCAQDTAQTTMGILTLDQHCQVPRTGGNGSEEYGHSWLVDPKLVTSGICSCPAAFWRPILNQQQQQSQRLIYLKAYKIVPLENSLMRRFPTVTSCRKDLLDSTMYVSGTQSNSTRRASSEKLLLPWKTKRGSVQRCCR